MCSKVISTPDCPSGIFNDDLERVSSKHEAKKGLQVEARRPVLSTLGIESWNEPIKVSWVKLAILLMCRNLWTSFLAISSIDLATHCQGDKQFARRGPFNCCSANSTSLLPFSPIQRKWFKLASCGACNCARPACRIWPHIYSHQTLRKTLCQTQISVGCWSRRDDAFFSCDTKRLQVKISPSKSSGEHSILTKGLENQNMRYALGSLTSNRLSLYLTTVSWCCELSYLNTISLLRTYFLLFQREDFSSLSHTCLASDSEILYCPVEIVSPQKCLHDSACPWKSGNLRSLLQFEHPEKPVPCQKTPNLKCISVLLLLEALVAYQPWWSVWMDTRTCFLIFDRQTALQRANSKYGETATKRMACLQN